MASGEPANQHPVLDQAEIDALLEDLSERLAALLAGVPNPCLIGIKRRGDVLAGRLAKRLSHQIETEVPLGTLDITLYRDDFDSLSEQPVVGETDIPFALDGRTAVLVDDVLFTGRTIRAALDELLELGRPARILLVVLIDRGWRELPIEATLAGLAVTTAHDDDVQVRLREIDGVDMDSVTIRPPGAAESRRDE